MKEKGKKTAAKGFSLIEVVVAITVFSLVMAAVFYFYSNAFNNREKLRAKFTELRLAREFMDSVADDQNPRLPERGFREKEDYRLEWLILPVEEGREILLTSGAAPKTQLHAVRLRLLKKKSRRPALELTFLHNRTKFDRK